MLGEDPYLMIQHGNTMHSKTTARALSKTPLCAFVAVGVVGLAGSCLERNWRLADEAGLAVGSQGVVGTKRVAEVCAVGFAAAADLDRWTG